MSRSRYIKNIRILNTDKNRFYSKVTIPNKNGCMEWTGSKFPNGYGQIKIKGKMMGAHRFSWKLINSHIPEKMCICHICDNKICVNIEHLFLGTVKDNCLDKVSKKRSVFGERNGRCVIKESDIQKIRKELSKGIDQRDIAKKYGVAQTTISAIKLKKSWKYLKENQSNV